ncbi:hypothetical protein [Pedobacter chitinilyticus]|uniref:Uncharacterized protein n=1 Tax=Pedobacter chitinilyticus TaxID=2233776 RepID=A0A3S4RSV6_9SPHI|nr:hypothetical protein [Pedobacter chitinilyticus]RWU10224.1 hypothetical protein DPV69_02445 [Pedobacter chitinilyticus]
MKKSILTFLAVLPFYAYSQAASYPSLGPGLFLIVFFLLLVFASFMVLRQVILWYWKVDKAIKNQDEQTIPLKAIYNSIEKNNRLTKAQIELVIGTGEQEKSN